MFFVRSDGTRVPRYLGPASHERASARFGPNRHFPLPGERRAVRPFSPNGRRIAFTDLGPGPGGEEAVQIVVLDLATGQRTQVTHLPSGSAPRLLRAAFSPVARVHRQRDGPLLHVRRPRWLEPEHDFAAFTVRIDGSGL